MRKIIITIMMFCLLPLLGSCNEAILANSFKRLDRGFTMECEMEIKLSSRYINTQYIEVEMFVETSPTEMYSEIEVSGIEERTYAKINDEEVEFYVYDGKWIKETISLEDYEDESELAVLDIDLDDFVLEDNVWKGDTEILTEELEYYFKEMMEDTLGSGTVSHFNVSKYNIEMNGFNISKIDISVDLLAYINGLYVSVEIDMPMEFSNVGKTKVTVPKGINN